MSSFICTAGRTFAMAVSAEFINYLAEILIPIQGNSPLTTLGIIILPKQYKQTHHSDGGSCISVSYLFPMMSTSLQEGWGGFDR